MWWTVYLFDRLLCSHLGYPVTVSDDDIDIDLPSMQGLDDAAREEFADPAHLVANIHLARITAAMSESWSDQCRDGTSKGLTLSQ